MELDKNKCYFFKDLIIYMGGIISNLICLFLINDIDIKYISVVLICINILPIYPLDGYNIFNVLLMKYIPYYFSLIISKSISVLVLIFVALYSIIKQIDLYIYLNLVYLISINIYTVFSIKTIHKNFLLEKYLYKFKYKIKIIRFKDNFQHYFYKYNTICMFLNNKYIEEIEILRILFEKK